MSELALIRWRRTLGAAILGLLFLAIHTPRAGAETRVVASIKPIHALVARVMEGVGEPVLLVRGSASPHSYAMRPSDARQINDANVFFRVSPSIEPFSEKIVATLPKSVRVVTLGDTHGLTLLDRRTGDTFEVHDHADDHARADHADHEEPDGHEDHEKAGRDGHIWLDPENAKLMVERIVMVLSETTPGAAEKLKSNAVRLLGELDQLRSDIARDLEPVKSVPFAVFHDAYQYFENSFGLKAVGSITVSPEVQPSAKRLSAIRAKIVALSAQCVFAEPQFSPGLVANVTEGTRARSATLDPEGTMVKEGPNAYFDIMRGLAAGLKNCLSGGG